MTKIDASSMTDPTTMPVRIKNLRVIAASSRKLQTPTAKQSIQ
jgi:hypothetical protein